MSLPIVYHPNYVVPLPEGHRFPMEKFRHVYALLLQDGVISLDQVHMPEIATAVDIQTVHDKAFVSAYLKGSIAPEAMRKIGLPWSQSLVTRTCTAVGGTLLTAELALQMGLACNTAGGTHHAFPNFGSGFCVFNDMAIAATILLNRGVVKRVLIVDLDVHQGDGTAFTFQNESRVFTFSMHCDVNFPFTKQCSDLDISLPEGLDDTGYLNHLGKHLPDLLQHVKPDLVLYDAGVDPHNEDKLGKLSLTDKGLYKRDEMVLSSCISRNVPIACVIGGGYADNIHDLAYRHSLLHRAAKGVFTDYNL